MYHAEFGELEHHPNIVITPPVTETLHDPAHSLDVFADDSTHDKLLTEQVRQHREHAEQVTELLDALPETAISIDQALSAGNVTEFQATRFYDSLSTLLQDPDNARLVLYFPFELIPSTSWQPETAELHEAATVFQQTYRNAWYGLLSVRDVRANFTDGDVMEEEYRDGDLPRVVKAAHLIPGLIERGILTEAEIDNLSLQATDPVLQQSIAESLAALRHTATDEVAPSKPAGVVIHESEAAIVTAINNLPPNITDRRREWLEQVTRDHIITQASRQIAQAIRSDTLPDAVIGRALTDTDSTATHILLGGLQHAILTTATQNPEQARLLFDRYSPMVSALYNQGDPETVERLTVSFRQLFHAGVIDKTLLEERGISLPNLKGPHSENLADIHEDIVRLGEITMRVMADPELSHYLYPVTIVGGSRLKGYGLESSDVDVSIFVRPNTSTTDKQHVRALAQAAFTHSGIAYEPIEFWLDRPNESTVSVHDFSPPDMHAADSYWTHILFGGAWVGDREAINELQRELLPSYFYAATPNDTHARQFYLERLEQDLLQYRLMHKGYARHYAPQARAAATYNPAIDGDSAFWDPGYRRLATRLFVNNVFLPKYTA